MSKALDRLAAEEKALTKRVKQARKRLLRGCKHERGYKCRAGNTGYLFMCARCYAEEHAWAPYQFGSSMEFVEITWNQFMDKRPIGGLYGPDGEELY